jgi:hypothetical protein
MKAVPIGLLNMSWDIICPVCRIAATNVSALKKIESHSNCEFCDLEFEVDFASSVELIFTVHPEVRRVDVGTYCIGGPFHSPHVIAQNRLLAGERVEIGTELQPGNYQIRGPQLDAKWEIKVNANAISTRTDIDLAGSATPTPELVAGQVCVCLENNSETELLARFEQNSEREDAVTAASVVANPLFQRLFPDESIKPQHLVEKSNLNLLGIWDADSEATIEEVGEIKMRSQWSLIQQAFTDGSSASSGELVESSHDFAIIAFEQLAELSAKLSAFYQSFSQHSEVKLRRFSFAIHRGELMMGNQPGQGKHFGAALREIKSVMEKMKSQPSMMFVNRHQLDAPELQTLFQQLANKNQSKPLADAKQFLQFSLSPL